MPRRLRPEIPGGFFHIFTRGNLQLPLFRDPIDYDAWLRMLARTIEGFAWRCHAYCAMSNHFHVLIETPESTRSAGMRHLNGSYAQRFNRRYEGSGHVFQGRYGVNLIEGDAQFLETCRYIVLNPLRAGICNAPHEWHWSSYRATAGITRPPAFLTVELVLKMFARDPHAAHERYRQFIADGQVQGPGPERIRHATRV